ncbi:uncharacterized protein PV09_00421 [Verruconis gallopava]|uniref:Uncharacterized protein n=1 Tax=Verruconis gallopava TaxID=253628 RepID=A0A0D2AS87_9PEZI|nr:uncharacterized protein PV09_00421 [Verruconis gallopava]KIW09548.1 hypothetical protein PV09_00421 [Verruconis gallopava]
MSRVSFVKQSLDFPPWCLEFDRRGYCYVGGGGGSGQRELKNKIAVFDTANRSELRKVAEVELEDDSCSSLAVTETGPLEAYLYGALNEPKEQKAKGNNRHLRSYHVKLPSRAQTKEKTEAIDGSIEEVNKVRLFSESYIKSEGFQRRTCLSRKLRPHAPNSGSSKRLLAICSSLSPESELLVVQGSKASPTAKDVVQRITPTGNAELNDVDLVEGDEPGNYKLVGATQHEVFISVLQLDPESMRPKAPLSQDYIWTAPIPDTFENKGRAKYKSVKFLSNDTVILLANIAGGSELQLLRLFDAGQAELILRKKLPKSVGSAVNMDVAFLNEGPAGERQAVIGVAAQKSSVLVFTMDLAGPQKAFRPSFKFYQEFTVSDAPMRAARFAPFLPPKVEASKEPPRQYLRLGSISLLSDITIDFLPLETVDGKPGSRYILQKTSGSTIGGLPINWVVIGFLIIIQVLLAQSYYSQKYSGGSSPQLLPQSWSDAIAAYRERVQIMGSPLARQVDRVTHTHAGERILSMLQAHHEESGHLPDGAKKAIVLSAPEEGAGLSTEIHESEADVLKSNADAKKWEELSKTQQQRWTEKLKKAGAWSADYGETIFKGVFFSELAGAVGRAAADAMAG